MKKRITKWSVLVASTTFAAAAIPGCDLTQVIEQLLGTVGAA